MQGEFECEGSVRLTSLPWEISERLAQFSGNWLEYSPSENAIVVRKSLPVGCPATTAVSCELITMLESLPIEVRQAMPGGEIFVRSAGGRIMRFGVEKGEIRIQWPTEDYAKPIPVAAETVLKSLNACEAQVNGWARFASPRSDEVRALVDRFGGLYPEGDMPSECEQNIAYIPFREASVDPEELVRSLKQLADPAESLQAEFEVKSAAPRSLDHDFRIVIQNGRIKAFRPALWK
jgi:hypothetical protein